jgi:hypothetical protein
MSWLEMDVRVVTQDGMICTDNGCYRIRLQMASTLLKQPLDKYASVTVANKRANMHRAAAHTKDGLHVATPNVTVRKLPTSKDATKHAHMCAQIPRNSSRYGGYQERMACVMLP